MLQKDSAKANEAIMATRLKQLRTHNGLTQAAVAKELQVSQQTYSNFEKGEGRLDVKLLKSVCDFYGVSSDYVLGLDERKERASEAKRMAELKMFRIMTDSQKPDGK